MPTYRCTVLENRLSAEQKARIASEVTRIHTDVTGAAGFFAQVIFEEVKPGNYFMGGAPLGHDQIFLFGVVRAGRASVDKTRMIKLMAASLCEASGVPMSGVWVYVGELPPRQMIEYGHVLPEPGDEDAWLASLSSDDRAFMQSVGKKR